LKICNFVGNYIGKYDHLLSDLSFAKKQKKPKLNSAKINNKIVAPKPSTEYECGKKELVISNTGM
jgi:hypothetical protein